MRARLPRSTVRLMRTNFAGTGSKRIDGREAVCLSLQTPPVHDEPSVETSTL